MSTREDDSRPSRSLVSQRPTARDVPIAKFKEVSVGTSPPRGLRGQSLLPGQGAPERIVPEDIELAVLREAETLDGPHVARAAARRLPELTSSPPPTPVSVEIPRVRSTPPTLETQAATPTTPSARSVQSGTLMSVGSVDPRAPTELSLPSPRVLSQSERAAYLGPEAVVDRAPAQSALMREQAAVAKRVEVTRPAEQHGSPHSEPAPRSSARSVPVGSGPVSSARPSRTADSSAPPARHFGRPTPSYSPLSVGPHSPERGSQPPSEDAPQFEIHAQLDAVPHEFSDDTFDLRSVSTQREPLAGRRPMESSDWVTVHEPVSARRDSAVPSERAPSRNPSSSSAITILVDPGRTIVTRVRDSLPGELSAAPARASVPLSWVLGAAAFAVLLALSVAWVLRAPAPREARSTDEPSPIPHTL
ncbi:MAG TPA: hypothetical protein VNW92_23395, partial [Polyangiaceae bacterium]|nr:hypothetical protein [Polyangiaceae bacterium]